MSHNNSFSLQLLTQTGWRKNNPGPVLESPGFEGPDRQKKLYHSVGFHFLHHYSCCPGLQTWSLSSCSLRDDSHCCCLRADKRTHSLSLSLTVSLSNCLSLSLTVSLSNSLTVSLSVCLSVSRFVFLTVSLSVSLSVCLSDCLSVCLSLCLSL